MEQPAVGKVRIFVLRTHDAARVVRIAPIHRSARAEPMVERPRLLARIQASLADSRLAVVCGPSGSGKTALATSWASHQPSTTKVVWHGLRPADRLGPPATDLRLPSPATRTVVVLDDRAPGVGDRLGYELHRLLT